MALRINPTRALGGSFRGIAFNIAQASAPGGRRHALHEYPDRDLPYAEDLGRRARRFQLACYFVGPLARLQAKAFVAALEKAGPGVLQHPTRGRQTVLVDTFDERLDKSRTDWVEYAVSFVESGQNFFPTSSISWPSALIDLADKAKTAFGDALDGALKVVGQAQEAIQAVQSAAGDVIGVLNIAAQVAAGRAPATAIAQALLLTGGFSEKLGGVFALAGFAQATIGLVGGWADTLVGDQPTSASRTRTIDALWSVYQGMPAIAPPGSADTPLKQAATGNEAAVATAVRRTALAEIARLSARVEFASYDDAVALRTRLAEAFDAEIDATTGTEGDARAVLQDLQSTAINAISAAGADKARLVAYVINRPQAAKRLAQLWYPDDGNLPARAAELVARTGAIHPSFLPAQGERLSF